MNISLSVLINPKKELKQESLVLDEFDKELLKAIIETSELAFKISFRK